MAGRGGGSALALDLDLDSLREDRRGCRGTKGGNLAVGRVRARTVKCPECGAEPGEICKGVKRVSGKRRRRIANHLSRVEAFYMKG